MCKTSIVMVALDGASGSYDKLYSYAVPDNLLGTACVGCRVFVPFGKGNKKRIGMIFSFADTKSDYPLKNIISVIDDTPVIGDEMLKICAWMHDNIFCTYFDAVNAMLPTGLKFKLADFYSINTEFADISLLAGEQEEIFSYLEDNGEVSGEKLYRQFGKCTDSILSLIEKCAIIHNVIPKRNLGDFTRRYVRLSQNDFSLNLTPRQQEICDVIQTVGEVSIKELQYFTGVSQSVISKLIDVRVIDCFEKQEYRMPQRKHSSQILKDIVLNDEQSVAFSGLKEKMLSPEGETALLYGVTGSGKTQVFLKLADEAIENRRGVIIMVPEIALTPQMINLFSSRYGSKVAVFHSAMSLGQRMDEYRRIKYKKALIAIGTRSAVFAPFDDLGLIVIDEEQEHTYKSEKSPRFDARDIAKLRIKFHKGLLCLSSATPSLQSYSMAIAGRYALYKLSHRYNDLSLPEVRIVNMKDELASGNSSNISRELAVLIGEQLASGKQSIILLNRRGHNTYVSCPECGYVATCENCSISLTYHSANKRLMCHYCGHSEPIYDKCPECGCEYLAFSGAGTQRITEELSTIFPTAKILRLDADSTMTRNAYSVNLDDFAAGKYDIMVGTQMVAKGLDFPKVSLVGVIGADRALSDDDYRGFERTFDLLTQVVGRAGRTEGRGIAVIQTSDNDNHIIDLARQQDYEEFYKEEIAARQIKIFPPFCDLCLVWSQSVSDNSAKTTIFKAFERIKDLIGGEFSDQHLIILGPNSAYVPKVGNRYRYRMLIKCKNTARFRKMISSVLDIQRDKDTTISVDINPENII